MQLWSFSTTVRNPERILPFLRVLKLLEGQPFDKENQMKYQILLIQHHLYKPTNIPNKYKDIFDDPTAEIPFDIAEKVFRKQNYQDPSMRGRHSANPITKLGFSIARESVGDIQITELGNKFIKEEFEIGYAFFKSLLKLQFPNPWSTDFKAEDGFNVVPFIAALHLINRVNQHSEKRGLTQTEFSLFVPSLINYKLIDDYVGKVFEYRNSKDKQKFIYKFAQEFYQTKTPTEKQIHNFSEYGDNIMRYFRLTRYFKVAADSFGADWRIDNEPTRQVEINQILKKFSGEAILFKTTDAYLKYIADISLPKLPSEDLSNSIQIAKSLVETIFAFAKSSGTPILKSEKVLLQINFSEFNKAEIDNYILQLRQINLDIKDRKAKTVIVNNEKRIVEIIELLKDTKAVRKISPEKFEQLLSDCLKIINDEIKIKPNYPVDDDGEPISHAAGSQPDIECFYKTYNAICEVTLDSSNFQWVRESQPVMRHLREFENKYSNLHSYCLFIAPKVHEDTLYHFWTSIKHGYNGTSQRIVPMTTEQFAILLETLLLLLKKGQRYNHTDIEKLYLEIIGLTNNLKGHSDWLFAIDGVLGNWKNQIAA
jgi:hypothetical protein